MLSIDSALRPDSIRNSASARKGAGKEPIALSTGSGKKFDRGFFVNTPDNTASRETGKGGNESGKDIDLVEFQPQTKKDFSVFLRRYVTNVHDTYTQPGGRDVLNAQPHAKELLTLLGGTEDELSRADLDRKINKMLESPQGWVLAKELIDQQTALQLFAAGFVHASSPDGDRETLGDAMAGWRGRQYIDGEGKVHKVGRDAGDAIAKRWKSILGGTGAAGAGGAVGSMGGPLGMVIGAIAGVAIAKGGKEAYLSGKEEGLTMERKALSEALNVIKSQPDLAKYMKATLGVDVNDFNVVDGKIQNAKPAHEHQSTQQMKQLLDGAMSNTITRMHYYDDLGVPPADRDAMPEQHLFEGQKGIHERSGERVQKRILERYREMQNRESQTQGPAKPVVENFINEEDWKRRQEDPDARDLGFDRFNPVELHPEKGAPDRWGQQQRKDDPIGSYFYGRAQGARELRVRYPENEEQLVLSGGVKIEPGSPDKWGQKPNVKGNRDAGYGEEKREARVIIGRIGKEHQNIGHDSGAIDNYDQPVTSIGFGRVDGQKIKLPDHPYKEALPQTNDEYTEVPFDANTQPGRNYVDRVDPTTGDIRRFRRNYEDVIVGTDNDGNPITRRNHKDIWGQDQYIMEPGQSAPGQPQMRLVENRFYGIMDVNNLRDIHGNRIHVNERDMMVTKATTPDNFGQGQKPTSLFYRIADGKEVALPEPDPRNQKLKNGKPIEEDIWGQKPDNPLYMRINEKLVGQYQPLENIPGEYLRDADGQRYMIPDPQNPGQEIRNPYFDRRNDTNVDQFDVRNFDKKYWRDKWEQSYYEADGKTKNIFFGKTPREVFLLRLAEDNRIPGIRPRGGVDLSLLTDEQIFAAIKSGQYPTINLSPKIDIRNFEPQDIVDSAGRHIDHDFFGRSEFASRNRHHTRGERSITRRRGERRGEQYRVLLGEDKSRSGVKLSETESPVRDSQGRDEDNPLFGLTDQQVSNILSSQGLSAQHPGNLPDADYAANFLNGRNFADGLDQWGQPPWSPFFARADGAPFLQAKREMAGFTGGRSRDKWGQPEGARGFGERPQGEGNFNIELYMKARELVMGDLTEQLIIKMREIPTKSVSRIEAKIKSRTEGAGLKSRKEQAGRDKTALEERLQILKSKESAQEAFAKAQRELAEAERRLPTYLTEQFGNTFNNADASVNATNAVDALRDLLHNTSTNPNAPIQMRIGGRIIHSVADRRMVLDQQRQQEIADLFALPRGQNESDKAFNKREDQHLANIQPSLDRIEQRYARLAEPIERDERLILSTIAEINGFQTTLADLRPKVEPTGEIARARLESVLPAQDADFRQIYFITQQLNATINNTTINIATDTPATILARINDPAFTEGWPASENNIQEHKELLAQALIVMQAEQRNADAVEDMYMLSYLAEQLNIPIRDAFLSPAEFTRRLEPHVANVKQTLNNILGARVVQNVINAGISENEIVGLSAQDIIARNPGINAGDISAAKRLIDLETEANPLFGRFIATGVSAIDIRDNSINELTTNDLPQVAASIQDTLETFATEMTTATQQSRTNTERQIARVQQQVESVGQNPEIQAETAQLEVTRDIMKRQAAIFGSTAEFMADVSTHLPLTTQPAVGTNPPIISVTRISDLSEREQTALSAAERGIDGDNLPVGVLELYDTLFNYRDRMDSQAYLKKILKVLPPKDLQAVMMANAEPTNPPIRDVDPDNLGEFITRLNETITGLQVNRRNLRKMFVGVIDHLEATALTLDEPDYTLAA